MLGGARFQFQQFSASPRKIFSCNCILEISSRKRCRGNQIYMTSFNLYDCFSNACRSSARFMANDIFRRRILCMMRPWFPLQFINREDPFIEFKDFSRFYSNATFDVHCQIFVTL